MTASNAFGGFLELGPWYEVFDAGVFGTGGAVAAVVAGVSFFVLPGIAGDGELAGTGVGGECGVAWHSRADEVLARCPGKFGVLDQLDCLVHGSRRDWIRWWGL